MLIMPWNTEDNYLSLIIDNLMEYLENKKICFTNSMINSRFYRFDYILCTSAKKFIPIVTEMEVSIYCLLCQFFPRLLLFKLGQITEVSVVSSH